MTTAKTPAGSNAKNIVLAFLKALNDEDFTAARKYASDDMKFEGVLGSRDGAEIYFADMARMRLKYDVKKAFQDGGDVCMLYDITMSGLIVFSCGWYYVEDAKISSIKVIFDPRPLLEMKEKNK